MFKNYFTIWIILAIGIILGGGSVWYSLQASHGIGGINVGRWTAWPFAGGAEADPYTIAKVARNGNIPLGATEGLAFEAKTDNSGRPLIFNCSYIISGRTPPARLWTLTAYNQDGSLVTPGFTKQSATYSGNLLRFDQGAFRVGISKTPVSGNWLSIAGKGSFYLVLRLYDTPATSSTGLASRRMPAILRGECEQ